MIDKIHLLHKTTLSRLGDVAILSNVQKPTQSLKENEETKEYVLNKQDKSPETYLVISLKIIFFSFFQIFIGELG